MGKDPDLSVIVPVLDEEETIPPLFSTLSRQEGIALQLLICDGGSADGTVEKALRLGAEVPFPVRVISAARGRGLQMNAGASVAHGETLLFLHADSTLEKPTTLYTALQMLKQEIERSGIDRVAGRFRLSFDLRDAPTSLPYYYLESKARLDRPDCIHGDQGIMVRKAFFEEIGPFDGSLPMLAETRFAKAIRHRGKWLLFPDEIKSSPRRFEKEGLFERQALNAIIMNFAAQGWERFFRALPAIYADNSRSGRLDLAAVLREIDGLILSLPAGKRLSLWLETGRYVRSHAWQLPFFMDVRRNFRRGIAAGAGETPILAFYDLHLERLTDNAAGRVAATTFTWLWFRLNRLFLFFNRAVKG